MDASIESFIKYRVNRLEEISLDLFGEDKKNLVPEICGLLRTFCLNRPESKFFNKARGTRLIRKDLKYYFPANFGIDIRYFTQGPELDFDNKKYKKAQKAFAKSRNLLMSFSRLMVMVITYDLLTVAIDFLASEDPALLNAANEQGERFFKIFADVLVDILEIPPFAKKLHLTRGNIKESNRKRVTRENHKTVLGLIEDGVIPLDVNKFEELFEKICKKRLTEFEDTELVLDTAGRVTINLEMLAQNPISDDILLKTMKYRYHLSSYLFMSYYYQSSREKHDALVEQVTASLSNVTGLPKEQKVELAEFLIGDQNKKLAKRVGFHFNPLPKSAEFNWEEEERHSIYLGEKPENPQLSPQKRPLPKAMTRAAKRPVCIMLDVSVSMSDCLDIAVRTLMDIFGKLSNHPVNLVLFSTYAGVLNQGIPIISQGPLIQQVPWLMKMVDSTKYGLRLGGWTSIGNGIMLAKSIALSTAKKMERYPKWISSNGIAAHCILISDNLHNTPRHITDCDDHRNYVIHSQGNVIMHAAKAGVSIHNVVCGMPTNGADKIVFQMQVIKYVEIIAKDYFQLDENGVPMGKAIEKQLKLTALNSQPKTFLFQYSDKDRFTLVNTWMKLSNLDQIHELASLVAYLRFRIKESQAIYDALEFIGREFKITPEDFLEDVIDMDKVFRMYEQMVQESEVLLEDLDYGVFDASPMEIFKISHCISETQRNVFPYSTTPVIVNLPKELDRRRDFNEFKGLPYFGPKNLEAIDRYAGYVAQQIEAMDE